MLDIGPNYFEIHPKVEKDGTNREKNMKWSLYLLAGVLLFAFLVGSVTGEALPEMVYVDLDGDGFNDNIADNDDNGIPDRFESEPAEELAEMGSILGNVFNTEVNLTDLYSTSEKFNMRKFKTRSLAQRCNGLGASDDFGPGNGIGLGAVSGGGGCAGGVCGP